MARESLILSDDSLVKLLCSLTMAYDMQDGGGRPWAIRSLKNIPLTLYSD